DPERGEVEDALTVCALERRVVGDEVRRLLEPLVQADRHLRRGAVEGVAAQHRRLAAPVHDRRHVDAQLPGLPRSQMHVEGRALLQYTTQPAELQQRAAPVAVAVVPEGDGARARLDPAAALA